MICRDLHTVRIRLILCVRVMGYLWEREGKGRVVCKTSQVLKPWVFNLLAHWTEVYSIFLPWEWTWVFWSKVWVLIPRALVTEPPWLSPGWESLCGAVSRLASTLPTQPYLQSLGVWLCSPSLRLLLGGVCVDRSQLGHLEGELFSDDDPRF